MSVSIILIVLVAALLHAFWNFLVKNSEDKYLNMSAVVIGHAPFAAVALIISPVPDIKSLPYILVGALLHVGYQLFLLASYRIGDLTQVYPLARGAAPLIVAGFSVIVLGLDLSWIELAAITIIGTGIMSLVFTNNSSGSRNFNAALLALITGVFIAAYSLVDGYGAREAGTALGFYGCLSLLNALIFSLIIRFIRPGMLTKLTLQSRKLLVIGGGSSFFAYAMVTFAFTLAPIALVAALRETSIIFSLLIGIFILKEHLDFKKVIATLFTILGVGLLRINN